MSNDEENPPVGKTLKVSEAPSPSSEIQLTRYNALLRQALVYCVAAGYCISASLLSVINKWAVMKFPYPGPLTALQNVTSAAGVLLCGYFKFIEYNAVDPLTMRRFLPATIIFYLSLHKH